MRKRSLVASDTHPAFSAIRTVNDSLWQWLLAVASTFMDSYTFNAIDTIVNRTAACGTRASMKMEMKLEDLAIHITYIVWGCQGPEYSHVILISSSTAKRLDECQSIPSRWHFDLLSDPIYKIMIPRSAASPPCCLNARTPHAFDVTPPLCHAVSGHM